jgi:hypothetical protein
MIFDEIIIDGARLRTPLGRISTYTFAMLHRPRASMLHQFQGRKRVASSFIPRGLQSLRLRNVHRALSIGISGAVDLQRRAVESVPTSLAVFQGDDIQRRVVPEARKAGTSNEDHIGSKASPEQLLQSLASASNRLQTDFGTLKTCMCPAPLGKGGSNDPSGTTIPGKDPAPRGDGISQNNSNSGNGNSGSADNNSRSQKSQLKKQGNASDRRVPSCWPAIFWTQHWRYCVQKLAVLCCVGRDGIRLQPAADCQSAPQAFDHFVTR